METRGRTLVKALVWNLIGLLTMSLIGLLTTGSLAVGAVTAAVNASVGLTMYVVYERAWGAIRWGRHHG